MPTQFNRPKAAAPFGWQQLTETDRRWGLYQAGAFLVCGSVSGVSVIDLDSNEHNRRFRELLADHPTPVARTPSGGHHILVRYSSADWWRNQVGRAPGLDLRNDRGGIALPMPSNERRWLRDPWSTPLADPGPYEQALLELAPRLAVVPVDVQDHSSSPGEGELLPNGRRSSLVRLQCDLAVQPEGNRGGYLHWAACTAIECGWDPWELFEPARLTGLTDQEIERTIRSAERRKGVSHA